MKKLKINIENENKWLNSNFLSIMLEEPVKEFNLLKSDIPEIELKFYNNESKNISILLLMEYAKDFALQHSLVVNSCPTICTIKTLLSGQLIYTDYGYYNSEVESVLIGVNKLLTDQEDYIKERAKENKIRNERLKND